MAKKGKLRGKAAVLALGLAAFALSGCEKEAVVPVPELVEPVGVDIDTAVVKKMDFSSVKSYEGEIVPNIKGLYFVSSGNIGKMYVSTGQKVKKGQLLATLSSVDSGVRQLQKQLREKQKENKEANQILQCDIDKMREELGQLKSRWKKEKGKAAKAGLKKQSAEKEEDIDIAVLQLSQQKQTQALELKHLRQDISAAKKQTKDSKLISPVNGEIISTAGGNGYMVQAGVTAVNVADMQHPRIQTGYVASDTLAGASRYVAVINGKEYRVKAEEQEISPMDLEMNIRPSNTWFDFVDAVNLKVGDSATIELYNDMAEDALVVPSNAVFDVKREHYVYKMNGDVKVKTNVTIGAKTDAYTQILAGLKEGDAVYVQN